MLGIVILLGIIKYFYVGCCNIVRYFYIRYCYIVRYC
jgi:hypothetical protein